MDVTPEDYDKQPWTPEAGPTVFAPFDHDTEYIGRAEQLDDRLPRFDLEAMVRQLQAAKIEVTIDPESYPNGRFARVYDPEGNPVELWEPK